MPYLNSTSILITCVKPNTMIATMNAHIEGLLLFLRACSRGDRRPTGETPSSRVILILIDTIAIEALLAASLDLFLVELASAV
jgi:hypothetical protein